MAQAESKGKDPTMIHGSSSMSNSSSNSEKKSNNNDQEGLHSSGLTCYI
jgi:hypothetical protein